MRLFSIISLALIAACGSTGLNGGQSDQLVNLGSGGNAALRMAASEAPHYDTLKSASIDKVFRLLPVIYDSLGIPVTDLDPTAHTIGNTALKVRRQIGNVNLTKYIDCGNAQGFASAEQYDIQISIRTSVHDVPPNGSAVSTMVEAVGRPVAFAGEFVRCSSKGALEQSIVAAVKARAR